MSSDLEKIPSDMPLLVTAAVVVCDGKVLLTRRQEGKRHPGMWEFPGGKVDPGESPEEALGREMLEELDVEVRITGIFEVAFYRYDWGPVLILAYSCEIQSGTIRNLDVAEHRWVAIHDIAELPILPADQPIIERLTR